MAPQQGRRAGAPSRQLPRGSALGSRRASANAETALVGRLGATVFAPPPDTAQDLIDKYGITAEQAGDGSPDLQWLRSGGENVHWYAAGNRLPTGIEAYAGREHNDLVRWKESVGAVIAGDSLADSEQVSR